MTEKLEDVINEELDKLFSEDNFKTDNQLMAQDNNFFIRVTFHFDLYDAINEYIERALESKKNFIQTADRIVFVLTINGEEKLPIIFNQELVSEIKNSK